MDNLLPLTRYVMHFSSISMLDIDNMGEASECLRYCVYTWREAYISGLAATILDLRLPVSFERLKINCVVFPVSENLAIAFGTGLLSCQCAEIWTFPV